MPVETLSPLALQLEGRAQAIADHLLSRKWATQPEIDACYNEPGVEDPELKIAFAWSLLSRMLFERTPTAETKRTSRSKADRVILDALRGAPAYVTLTEPIGELRRVVIHPKSLNALVELTQRDVVIEYFNRAIETLRNLMAEDPTLERTEQLARATREVSYQQQLCAWIVTHAGPGLPYPDGETAPALPEWLGQLSPLDLLMIFRAHQDVNAGRLAALQSLPRAKGGSDDEERGWGVFLSGLASFLNTKVEELARDWSLAALFAQSYIHAVEQERAMEAAKEK